MLKLYSHLSYWRPIFCFRKSMIVLLIFLEEDIHPSSKGIQKDHEDPAATVRTLRTARIQGYLQPTISFNVNHRSNEEWNQQWVLLLHELKAKEAEENRLSLQHTKSLPAKWKELGKEVRKGVCNRNRQEPQPTISFHHKLSSIEIFVAREMFKITAALAIA